MKKKVIIAFGLGIILTLSIAFTFESCNTKAQPEEEPFFLNHAEDVNYVGKEACKVCHTEHASTFSQTGMGQSFGHLTPTKSAAYGINSKAIYDVKTGMYYAAKWEAEQLFIHEFKLSNSDTTYHRKEEIKYVVGSGQHTNSHFWEENGYLYQAPLTFYTQKGIWDLPPGFETYNSRWDRRIELECMSCHNAMPKLTEHTRNHYIDLPKGIDCERCHGPGELHVKEKTAGHIVDTSIEADRTIVNPKRLPWKLQIDVCQRCHLQGNNVLKPGKSFTDFKPGMRLSDVFEIYMPNEQNGEFVMAGHAERFQMSECFKNSNANIDEYNPQLNFTCINCHNPHVSVRKTNIKRFNATCNGCHKANGKSKYLKCSIEPSKLKMAKNNCVSCHMPANNTKDIPHVTVHDHYIKRPGKNIPDMNKTDLLYCVNETEGKQMAEALITWYEKFDDDAKYFDKAGTLIASERAEVQIHYHYAHAQWSSIIVLGVDLDRDNMDVWTAYRIAKAFDRVGQLPKSIVFYKKAYDLLNLDDQFVSEYANALIRNTEFKKAKSILQGFAVKNKKSTLIYYNRALLLANTNNLGPASKMIGEALLLNPNHQASLALKKEIFGKLNRL
ncbi:multiheme c-type cytochrome [Bacteroidia bacterium]|nr:multiheme c-type cytochrome [Bacteroidia bacterium]